MPIYNPPGLGSSDLTSYAPLASPTLTGNPVAPTASPGDNDTSIATTAFVTAAVAALVAGAPGALNTLLELSAALGDDASFATTVTNALALKAPILNVPIVVSGTTDTLATGDNGKVNRYTNAALVTVTLPTDAGDDLADGFTCTLVAEGAAGLTLSTAGITLQGAALTTVAQGEAMVVIKTATADTWLVLGGTS